MRVKHLLAVLVLVSVGVPLSSCVQMPPQPGQIFYTALGASDAVGIGAFPLRNGYVFRIRDDLVNRGRQVELLNLGIPGAGIGDIKRVSRLVLVAGTRPTLVTLWTGANDLIDGDDPGNFEQDLEDILSELRERTSALIVVGDLPDLTRLPRFIQEPDSDVTVERVSAFNAAIERQASNFNASIARLSELDMLEELTSDIDGFHPDNEGHRRIAEHFIEVILPELGLSQ